MRVNDWYFRGWEKKKGPNGKTTLVYTGEYYSFKDGIAPLKKTCGVLTVLLIVFYALVAFFPSEGGMWRFSAIPQLLELIPMLYLIIGTVNLLRVKGERMTFREYYGSWHNIRWTVWGSTALTALMCAAEVVYLCLPNDNAILPIREMLYFMGDLICLAISIAYVAVTRKNPCSQTM